MWILVALVILFGIVGLLVSLVILFPARSVRPEYPPVRIDSFDVHPRHVCRNDTLTARWRGAGDSGTLTASILGGSPFFSQSIDTSQVTDGSATFRADTTGSFIVELMVVQGSGSDRTSTTRSVGIIGHDSPNEVITLSVQPTFTPVPPAAWTGRRVFYSDPTVDPDDWSTRITVAGLRYREAGGRDIIVSWRGIEIATLSPSQPDHMNAIEITVAGEWDLFVPAAPGDSALETLLPVVSIDLIPRCVVR